MLIADIAIQKMKSAQHIQICVRMKSTTDFSELKYEIQKLLCSAFKYFFWFRISIL